MQKDGSVLWRRRRHDTERRLPHRRVGQVVGLDQFVAGLAVVGFYGLIELAHRVFIDWLGERIGATRHAVVRPVLTAHPTESTRRTLLALQALVRKERSSAELLKWWRGFKLPLETGHEVLARLFEDADRALGLGMAAAWGGVIDRGAFQVQLAQHWTAAFVLRVTMARKRTTERMIIGNMIAAGQTEFERHPHLVFIPAAGLFMCRITPL